ncbi:MAG TPA: phenylacetate--CoA ligase family protein, partial [Spirochaetota bacterium]|nr:phenylacetate--CoA ligase family protein [Spirochaetota bacterium]
INLNPKDWRAPDSAKNFIKDLSPIFLSGDPISFMEMMKQGIDYKPKAFLSSALQLSGELRRELETKYNCPVIDLYSLNETGPIAFSLPDDPEYFQILPTDIYVEIVDDAGRRLPEGEYGEITVTGGRNPYFPALRYKTGDTGAIFYNHKFDGKTPLLKLLDSRKPVIFLTNSGNRINSIDISRILRKYPIYRHQVIQNKDKNLIMNLDAKNISLYEDEIIKEMRALFNNDIDITISDNFITKNSKITAYIVE